MSQINTSHTPIIIIGMARSGTTLVSHILGNLTNVHIEIEPHALWKTGNFKYFNDEEFDITDDIVNRIRARFIENVNEKVFIEKSPINSVRPNMVHAVFPEAKIIYIERDPVRCIYSNYIRSVNKDSFKLSIILKKYFLYTGSSDLPGAISSRKLFQQLAVSDIPDFIKNTVGMFNLRRKDVLPFGPKIKNFASIVKTRGMLAYHADVYKAALKHKQTFEALYGDKMQVFKMEHIMNDVNEIKKMVNFIGVPYSDEWGQALMQTFDSERVKEATKHYDIDKEIIKLIETEKC